MAKVEPHCEKCGGPCRASRPYNETPAEQRAARDLELLAKLRAHPGFAQILSLVLSWHQTAEESRDPIIDPRGHAGEYCGASSLLIQLLRGGV